MVLSKQSALVGLVSLAMISGQASADAEPSGGAVISMAGRVLAREGDRPVAGAVIVTRVGSVEEKVVTNSDGRFTFHVPSARKADPLARFSLTIRHPDFITKTGIGETLADMLARGIGAVSRRSSHGYGSIRGIEYTGEVVLPDGSPAAALDLWFQNWGWTNYQREEGLSTENKVRTDAEGRFRLRMWKTKAIEINAIPDDFAPLQHFIGDAGPSKERPHYAVPPDLGRFVLEDGIRVSGRLLDRDGRPIAGERVEIVGRIRVFIKRTATTGLDGAFVFGPLRPGSYSVQPERQGRGGYVIDHGEPAHPPPSRAFRPCKIVLRADNAVDTIELKEAATVAVTCRFVDLARRRPVKGGGQCGPWGGLIPDAKGKADPFEVPGRGMTLASEVNQAEPEDPTTRLDWGVQAVSDSEGKVVFRAPDGLRNTSLTTFPPDAQTSIRTRLGERVPLKFWGGGQLGSLVKDVPDAHLSSGY